MFMTNQQSAKLAEPGVGSFYDPATLVAAEFASIFVAPFLVVLAIGGNHFDVPLAQALPQGIGIIAGIGDHALRLLSRTTSRLRHRDRGQRGFRKRNFCRRGTFQPNSQRNTFTVCQYHPLRSLAALRFPDGRAPFLAGAKLPSKKLSSQRSNPFSSSAPSRVRQASNQTPCSCQRCNRRQQVADEGNSSGRNRHAAPVCRIQRMPSRHARFGTGGRPRLSARRLGRGNKGAIRSHCSFVNSLCRFFIAEAQPRTYLTRKYLM
jgi:hypothetical protein